MNFSKAMQKMASGKECWCDGFACIFRVNNGVLESIEVPVLGDMYISDWHAVDSKYYEELEKQKWYLCRKVLE